jgi:hypothetical protein
VSLYFSSPYGLVTNRSIAPAPAAGAPAAPTTRWQRDGGAPAAVPYEDRRSGSLIGQLQQQAAQAKADAAASADLQKQLDALKIDQALAEGQAAGAETLLHDEEPKSKLPIVLAVGGVLLLIGIVFAVKGRKSVAGYRRKRRSRR